LLSSFFFLSSKFPQTDQMLEPRLSLPKNETLGKAGLSCFPWLPRGSAPCRFLFLCPSPLFFFPFLWRQTGTSLTFLFYSVKPSPVRGPNRGEKIVFLIWPSYRLSFPTSFCAAHLFFSFLRHVFVALETISLEPPFSLYLTQTGQFANLQNSHERLASLPILGPFFRIFPESRFFLLSRPRSSPFPVIPLRPLSFHWKLIPSFSE